MQIEIRQYEQRDAVQAAEIWNEVVEDGKAFPQMEKLDEVTGHAFFTEQTAKSNISKGKNELEKAPDEEKRVKAMEKTRKWTERKNLLEAEMESRKKN